RLHPTAKRFGYWFQQAWCLNRTNALFIAARAAAQNLDFQREMLDRAKTFPPHDQLQLHRAIYEADRQSVPSAARLLSLEWQLGSRDLAFELAEQVVLGSVPDGVFEAQLVRLGAQSDGLYHYFDNIVASANAGFDRPLVKSQKFDLEAVSESVSVEQFLFAWSVLHSVAYESPHTAIQTDTQSQTHSQGGEAMHQRARRRIAAALEGPPSFSRWIAEYPAGDFVQHYETLVAIKNDSIRQTLLAHLAVDVRSPDGLLRPSPDVTTPEMQRELASYVGRSLEYAESSGMPPKSVSSLVPYLLARLSDAYINQSLRSRFDSLAPSTSPTRTALDDEVRPQDIGISKTLASDAGGAFESHFANETERQRTRELDNANVLKLLLRFPDELRWQVTRELLSDAVDHAAANIAARSRLEFSAKRPYYYDSDGFAELGLEMDETQIVQLCSPLISPRLVHLLCLSYLYDLEPSKSRSRAAGAEASTADWLRKQIGEIQIHDDTSALRLAVLQALAGRLTVLRATTADSSSATDALENASANRVSALAKALLRFDEAQILFHLGNSPKAFSLIDQVAAENFYQATAIENAIAARAFTADASNPYLAPRIQLAWLRSIRLGTRAEDLTRRYSDSIVAEKAL
ncbi:MAG: hypothetical protein AAGG44_20215, partial [Planctomycetota bacterium]